jgi:hypothetical protein
MIHNGIMLQGGGKGLACYVQNLSGGLILDEGDGYRLAFFCRKFARQIGGQGVLVQFHGGGAVGTLSHRIDPAGSLLKHLHGPIPQPLEHVVAL